MKRKNDGNVRKSATFAGFTARAVMCIAAGLLVLSFLSILVNPAKIWVMTSTQHTRPWTHTYLSPTFSATYISRRLLAIFHAFLIEMV